ncbi:MAG: N-acetylmuramoyl-L-alanine amidase, partial [Gemmatimonadaceae bacterium]
REGALVTSRDSNFIHGSVGNGNAKLWINGVEVPVLPNGAFLAFLANPSPDSARYELMVALNADTVRKTHAARILPRRPVLPLAGPLVVDSASVVPQGVMALRDDEAVRVSVRAPTNVFAWVQLDSVARHPLVNGRERPGPPLASVGQGSASDSASQRYLGDAEIWATDVPARLLRNTTHLLVARGSDTVRFPLAPVAHPDSLPRWVVVGADSSAVSDTDRVINLRPTPAGTYKWFLLPGTQLELTGRIGDFVRLRLDSRLEAWANASDVRPLPRNFPAPRRVASNARVVPSDDWVDLVIPVGERPAFFVEERDRAIHLTIYNARSSTDIIRYVANDTFVRVVNWEQETSDRIRYSLELVTRPFGYLAFWDRDSLVLRVRKPPAVNPRTPLSGLTIAVDPGHPPIGATGPTGLYEAVPVLEIGLKLKAILEKRGARVVMTRTTPEPVALGERPIIARRADAHALVSIHLNALPDGVNPFAAHGTGTYFFHPQSAPLARAIQTGMVRWMGLRNLGIYYDNLALARPTWMPAVLCEGAFIMIPEQEAALRTAEFQTAYALGVADGLEAYFRALPAAGRAQ